MLARFVCLGLALTAAVASAAPAPGSGAGPKLSKAALARIKQLQLERRDALKKAVKAREQEFLAGRGTLHALLKLTQQLLQAELEVATKAEQRVAAHAAYLELAKQVEKMTEAAFKAGRV